MGISYFIDKSDKKTYYQLLGKNLRKQYEKNLEYNLEYALTKKRFKQISVEIECIDDSYSNYSWLSYFLEHINEGKNSLSSDWKQFLFEEIQHRSFFNQYKYQNDIYFQELLINKPKYKQNKTGEHFLESEPIVFPLNTDELKNYSESKIPFDIDTRPFENLSFSFNSSSREDNTEVFLYNYTIDYDDTSSKINNNSDNKMKYNSYILKKYIKIIRKHIEKEDHPIHIIINQFIYFFGGFLKINIDFCRNNQNDEKQCNEKVLDVVKEIQNFIEIMQVTLKLFYSKSINFKNFVDEKDEIINICNL